MGITIRYRGRLNDKEALPSLVDEMKDIAESIGCKCHVFDDDWDAEADTHLSADEPGRIEGNLGLNGIILTPHPESEPLVLLFERGGTLQSPMNMIRIQDGTVDSETARIAMKTQFAGLDLHVWVVGLLKYLKKKYISDLDVDDESDYWQTGDRERLERKMAFIDDKIQSVSSQLASAEMSEWSGLTASEVADRIEQMLRDEGEDG